MVCLIVIWTVNLLLVSFFESQKLIQLIPLILARWHVFQPGKTAKPKWIERVLELTLVFAPLISSNSPNSINWVHYIFRITKMKYTLHIKNCCIIHDQMDYKCHCLSWDTIYFRFKGVIVIWNKSMIKYNDSKNKIIVCLPSTKNWNFFMSFPCKLNVEENPPFYFIVKDQKKEMNTLLTLSI